MADRRRKTALYEEFAAVGKALAGPSRLELLDLLAQGPRSVEDLATAASLKTSTCSAHLQVLRTSGLVTATRDGTRVVYALAGPDVAALFDTLRDVARSHRPQTEAARRAYLGPDDVEEVTRDELLRRAASGDVVVLDVRPAAEYAAGHLPGAVHVPLDELAHRLGEIPADRDVVAYCRGAYCVLARDAARLLNRHGHRALRSAHGVLEWRLDGVPLETGAA